MKTPLAQRVPWTLVVFLLAMIVPWLGSKYETFLATQIAISGLFAVSLNLLLGTTGLVSFGILIFPSFSIFSVFALMAVILIVRPWGLFGRPLR